MCRRPNSWKRASRSSRSAGSRRSSTSASRVVCRPLFQRLRDLAGPCAFASATSRSPACSCRPRSARGRAWRALRAAVRAARAPRRAPLQRQATTRCPSRRRGDPRGRGGPRGQVQLVEDDPAGIAASCAAINARASCDSLKPGTAATDDEAVVEIGGEGLVFQGPAGREVLPRQHRFDHPSSPLRCQRTRFAVHVIRFLAAGWQRVRGRRRLDDDLPAWPERPPLRDQR